MFSTQHSMRSWRGMIDMEQVRRALASRLLKFCFSRLYPAFETGSVVLVECY